jgi:hypothetical protein
MSAGAGHEHEAVARPRNKRRPALVWFIASFCISSGLWGLLMYYQIASGMHPLPASKLAYFENYSGFDYLPLMAVHALNVVAGVLLLLLRKEAVYVFCGKFVFAVGVAVWNALEKSSMDTSEPQYIIIGLLLWSASAAVCFYAWYLMRKGVLR